MSLPRGLPSVLLKPMAWHPNEFDERSGVYILSNLQTAEVDRALESFKGTLIRRQSRYGHAADYY
jgi:hypothetical protein